MAFPLFFRIRRYIMKCPYCGKEYSPKVMRIHAPLCKLEHAEPIDNVIVKMDAPKPIEKPKAKPRTPRKRTVK
jgi:hypothetical protein